MEKAEEKYLIWSVEHGAWWAKNKNGYVASFDTAGQYSKEDAFKISARANWRSLNEVPVPADFFRYQRDLHEFMESKDI